MKPPPRHLVETRDPPATRRDIAMLAFLFIGTPLAVAAIIWWNA